MAGVWAPDVQAVRDSLLSQDCSEALIIVPALVVDRSREHQRAAPIAIQIPGIVHARHVVQRVLKVAVVVVVTAQKIADIEGPAHRKTAGENVRMAQRDVYSMETAKTASKRHQVLVLVPFPDEAAHVFQNVTLELHVTRNFYFRMDIPVVPAFSIHGVDAEKLQSPTVDFRAESSHHAVVFKLIKSTAGGGENDDRQPGVSVNKHLHLATQLRGKTFAVLPIHARSLAVCYSLKKDFSNCNSTIKLWPAQMERAAWRASLTNAFEVTDLVTEQYPADPTFTPEDAEVVGVAPQRRLRLHRQFHSTMLPDDRDLIVYLPKEYDRSDRRYPVLYLHDGQNLFDGNTSYIAGRTWSVHETADRLIASGQVEPLIIVGIYNSGEHRIREYTPTNDPKYGGGEADLYGRLLIEEIKPFIDKTYRTLKGPPHTGLGGSSLGGLVTLYLGLLHPDVFGKLAVLSPSVWWNQKSILAFVTETIPTPRPRIWLDMGTKEGIRTLKDSDVLHQLLVERGWVDGVDVMYLHVHGGTHDEVAWATRVGPFLKFLFPARGATE